MNRREFEEKKLLLQKQPDWEYFEILRKSNSSMSDYELSMCFCSIEDVKPDP